MARSRASSTTSFARSLMRLHQHPAREYPRPLEEQPAVVGQCSGMYLPFVPSASAGPGSPHARSAPKPAVRDTPRMPEESTIPDLVELTRQAIDAFKSPRP